MFLLGKTILIGLMFIFIRLWSGSAVGGAFIFSIRMGMLGKLSVEGFGRIGEGLGKKRDVRYCIGC